MGQLRRNPPENQLGSSAVPLGFRAQSAHLPGLARVVGGGRHAVGVQEGRHAAALVLVGAVDDHGLGVAQAAAP